MISWNDQQWQEVLPSEKAYSYLYYNAPIVQSISPQFGPVKSPNNQKAIITGQNFECPDPDCHNLMVRFGDREFGTLQPGNLLSST